MKKEIYKVGDRVELIKLGHKWSDKILTIVHVFEYYDYTMYRVTDGIKAESFTHYELVQVESSWSSETICLDDLRGIGNYNIKDKSVLGEKEYESDEDTIETLEYNLKIREKNEEYEKCAAIRDELIRRKNNNKK